MKNDETKERRKKKVASEMAWHHFCETRQHYSLLAQNNLHAFYVPPAPQS
jgi:hypothetical protein